MQRYDIREPQLTLPDASSRLLPYSAIFSLFPFSRILGLTQEVEDDGHLTGKESLVRFPVTHLQKLPVEWGTLLDPSSKMGVGYFGS